MFLYIHIISSPLQEQIDELMAQNARDEEEDQEEEEEEEESWIFIQNKNHLISKALFSSYPKFLCESPSIQSLTFGLETQCILRIFHRVLWHSSRTLIALKYHLMFLRMLGMMMKRNQMRMWPWMMPQMIQSDSEVEMVELDPYFNQPDNQLGLEDYESPRDESATPVHTPVREEPKVTP